MGSFSIWHWLIVLLVVVLIFGTKKLRNIGGDVGGAVKSFKDAMEEGKASADAAPIMTKNPPVTNMIDAEVVEPPVGKAETKKKVPVKKPVKADATNASPKTLNEAVAVKKPTKAATKTSPSKTTVSKAVTSKTAGSKPKASTKSTTTPKVQ